MNIDKLMEFLSPKDKGFLISSIVLFPLAYTVLLMYGESKFLAFDLIDRIFIAICVVVLFQFYSFAALVSGDRKIPKKGVMSISTSLGCVFALLFIIGKLIFGSEIGWWFPIIFTSLGLTVWFAAGINKPKPEHERDKDVGDD